MGLEVIVDSLEDMCDLMCDNRVPEGKMNEKRIHLETMEEMRMKELRELTAETLAIIAEVGSEGKRRAAREEYFYQAVKILDMGEEE